MYERSFGGRASSGKMAEEEEEDVPDDFRVPEEEKGICFYCGRSPITLRCKRCRLRFCCEQCFRMSWMRRGVGHRAVCEIIVRLRQKDETEFEQTTAEEEEEESAAPPERKKRK